jgi:hypothetical protein
MAGMKWLGLAAMAAVVAGCGESKPPPSEAHVAFSKACVAGGGTEASCDCQAVRIDALVASGEMSADFQRAVLLQEQGDEAAAEEIMQTLDVHQLFNQISRLGDAKQACNTPS